MKKRNKALLTVACAVLLVVVSVMGTFAYLTDEDTAVNTFTVGNVDIELDEADVDQAGVPVEGADRVKANSYKLIPGHTYVKDPTVTVKEGSERSYVRMLVTVNNKAVLDEILPNADLTVLFEGYDAQTWLYEGVTTEGDERTYEFRYVDPVAAPDKDEKLPALFQKLTIPGSVTKEQLAKLRDFNITIVAQAVQADGFGSADIAWDTAF